MSKVKKALVVEGGGMRGIYSAGILDGFMEAGYDPFDLYIGVSAGACNLSSHVADQYERNLRVFTGLMSQPEFFSLWKFLKGGHYMDLDWFWKEFAREDPLDYENAVFRTRNKEFVIVCTSVETGEPRYIEPDITNWSEVLKASCALPVLYRSPIPFESETLVDGGVADAIPVEEAWRRGARKIMVLRSQPAGYRKRDGLENRVVSLVFHKHSGLVDTVRRKAAAYNNSLRFMENPPGDLEVIQVAPARALLTRRTSQDLGKLLADYQLGRDQARTLLASGEVFS